MPLEGEVDRATFHMILHFAVPLAFALGGFRERWRTAFLVIMATMAVDLDHLLADPLYDPFRCSINFHPLHSDPAIGVYALLLVFPLTRLPALGLLIHMSLDGLDCIWMGLG